jgi:segregation and condensation protein B
LIYATTKRFLEVFDLKNLKDLPTPKEIEEFGSALSEEMDPTDREAQAAEISIENTEETEASSVPEQPESPVENPQASMDLDEAKPDPDA